MTQGQTQPFKRRLWGRRMTRPLGKERALAFESVMPAISIHESDLASTRDPSFFFEKKFSSHWLEIGFGNGEHLVALKKLNPDIGFIGAEPFINGIAAIAAHLRDEPKENIRIFGDDALLLVEKLAPESLERIYVLNPDPWPKKRHHKRRIISQKNLAEFDRVLRPGGLLIMSTDVDGLAEWMVTQAMNYKGLEWQAHSSSEWKNPPPGWASSTRYADWGQESGRNMTYLIFKKLAKAPI